MYLRGTCEMIDNTDTDFISFFDLREMVMSYGYPCTIKMYYLLPEAGLKDGIKEMCSDKEVTAMLDAYKGLPVLCMYVTSGPMNEVVSLEVEEGVGLEVVEVDIGGPIGVDVGVSVDEENSEESDDPDYKEEEEEEDDDSYVPSLLDEDLEGPDDDDIFKPKEDGKNKEIVELTPKKLNLEDWLSDHGDDDELHTMKGSDEENEHKVSRRFRVMSCSKCLKKGHILRSCKNAIHPNFKLLKKKGTPSQAPSGKQRKNKGKSVPPNQNEIVLATQDSVHTMKPGFYTQSAQEFKQSEMGFYTQPNQGKSWLALVAKVVVLEMQLGEGEEVLEMQLGEGERLLPGGGSLQGPTKLSSDLLVAAVGLVALARWVDVRLMRFCVATVKTLPFLVFVVHSRFHRDGCFAVHYSVWVGIPGEVVVFYKGDDFGHRRGGLT
ncbi:hypothetical protein RHSIM_RhsimUnG0069900 [Rhododendron simsii]|uniref:PB1-like domain-containing protein n=1 Tax=Rhododendron simsii TaxID=118357 RepID=A0A834FWX1_RHOSS|nr:hypothetical protein RHSIM_RhsimUnG0069900 [Rhododendron simsii]